MEWEVRIEKGARKELDKIPLQYQKKVLVALPIIASDPFIGKKLSGKLNGLYSYQVWPYRIIYKIYKNILLVIIIIHIGHRQSAYK
jgi:addiction module RelE/StbE family toxin